MNIARVLSGLLLLMNGFAYGAESVQGELIFPLESWHNHGSAIVECPNGDMLVCWFHGSGERRSDDVEILGARWVKATGEWTEPFQMADTPEFPDTNCTMIIDQNETLWLLWPVIQANLWESALMKIKKSTNYMMAEGAPEWDVMTIMHVKHEGDYPAKVKEKLAEYMGDAKIHERTQRWIDHVNTQAEDKLTRRLGWFTRAHPLILDDGRMLVGLYSDGFSFSLVGITDDLGKTWKYSEPIVGGGNIQPSFAQKKDGTIVAYMRDNGPAPKRVHVSESKDRGETWSKVYDHDELFNPGSGLEVMTMSDGDWVCIYNDKQSGRHSLAVSLSEDEGETWKYTRHLEAHETGQGGFHYPSIIEGSDGNLHVSYSYFIDVPHGGEEKGKSIKYATFSKDWIKGD
ncbi:MAG: exo-alpha-sialidase [Candidatus Hydrogenedentota bacterium]